MEIGGRWAQVTSDSPVYGIAVCPFVPNLSSSTAVAPNAVIAKPGPSGQRPAGATIAANAAAVALTSASSSSGALAGANNSLSNAALNREGEEYQLALELGDNVQILEEYWTPLPSSSTLSGRRQLLSHTLSHEELAKLRKKLIAKLEQGSRLQGLDLIVRHPEKGHLMGEKNLSVGRNNNQQRAEHCDDIFLLRSSPITNRVEYYQRSKSGVI
ncbi:hypothetical protein HK101_007514 [Irineochytrium annulatum]|nr:hypothetical protein HK101_007514 [Irineochytrium annulatum]